MGREHQTPSCCVTKQCMSHCIPSHTGWFAVPPSDPRDSNMKESGLLTCTHSPDNIRITQFDA